MVDSPAQEQAEWQRQVERLVERLALDAPTVRLEQALTHPSFANEQRREAPIDNQRLEFLGDAVLGLCVSEMLMEAFTSVDEGALTLMRASLVNTDALADCAGALELGAALRMGRGAAAAGEHQRANVLADVMEAVIGAVFLDHGLDKAREVSRVALADGIAQLLNDGGIERDAKSRLQELVQARGSEPPTYTVAEMEGPPHARLFTVEVSVQSEPEPIVARGTGRSKKLAEQAAATAALAQLDSAG